MASTSLQLGSVIGCIADSIPYPFEASTAWSRPLTDGGATAPQCVQACASSTGNSVRTIILTPNFQTSTIECRCSVQLSDSVLATGGLTLFFDPANLSLGCNRLCADGTTVCGGNPGSFTNGQAYAVAAVVYNLVSVTSVATTRSSVSATTSSPLPLSSTRSAVASTSALSPTSNLSAPVFSNAVSQTSVSVPASTTSTAPASSSSSDNSGTPTFLIPAISAGVIVLLAVIFGVITYRYIRRKREYATEATSQKLQGGFTGSGPGSTGYSSDSGLAGVAASRGPRPASYASTVAPQLQENPYGGSGAYDNGSTHNLIRSPSQASMRNPLSRKLSIASMDGNMVISSPAPPVPTIPSAYGGSGASPMSPMSPMSASSQAASMVTLPGSSMLLDPREAAMITNMDAHQVQAEVNGWGRK
ncbi:hypothetical protein BC829DRAFT_486027 [Chytridium lagenaria]|nr:hypothetical protein BC829DRAFT_486027 [Chytridium lagenaria]